MAGITPSQTVGPFFAVGLSAPGAEIVADGGTVGRRISIEGVVVDGAGQPVPDAVIEIWQADASGRYAGRAPGVGPTQSPVGTEFRGFGRCATDVKGRFTFSTVMPGQVAGSTRLQAPHLLVNVLARGILTGLVTRMYFDRQASNESDEILQMVPAERRMTLLARLVGDNRYRFDIVLQGNNETVFFDV